MKGVIIIIIQKMNCSNSKNSNSSKNGNSNSNGSNICYSFIDLLQGLRFGGFRDQGFVGV